MSGFRLKTILGLERGGLSVDKTQASYMHTYIYGIGYKNNEIASKILSMYI